MRGEGLGEGVNWESAQVHDSIVKYYSLMADENNWMRNPLSIETSEMPEDFTVGQQETLTELSCDKGLKQIQQPG